MKTILEGNGESLGNNLDIFQNMVTNSSARNLSQVPRGSGSSNYNHEIIGNSRNYNVINMPDINIQSHGTGKMSNL